MVERRRKVSPSPPATVSPTPRESPPALEPHDVMRKHIVAARKIFGVGRTQLDEGIARGTIPRPIRLGARAVGWTGAQILKWQADRIAEAEKEAAREAAERGDE